MRQRARTAGVLSNPYRYIEAGAEFEHDEPMKWADPVDEPAEGKPARRKRAQAEPAAGEDTDPI